VSPRRALFLDRDGVINALVPDPRSGLAESPLRAADVELLDGVVEPLEALAGAGFLLIGVSNQPAAAKGTASRAELAAVQERVLALLAEQGVRFEDFRICWHHPEGTDPELGVVCDCRKPAPGMLLEAARDHDIALSRSWLIGDTDADVLAGAAAGTRTVLIEHAPSAHKRNGASAPTRRAADLGGAAVAILDADAS
jgi:D-glycero-D-manno-heptose 1,7-bisphosphate phosphatase